MQFEAASVVRGLILRHLLRMLELVSVASSMGK